MISLSNLEEHSAQEVFDQIANHLLTQNERSRDEKGYCKYRLNDLKCAVGCLMTDEEYDDKYEEVPVGAIIPDSKHVRLLQQLQMVHDTHSPENWSKTLERVATKFELEFKG